MIDQYYNHSTVYQRRTQDFAKSRRISPASTRLYTGASREPYDEELFREHDVKRGLRNADGSGVVAGLTRISDVHGYRKEDGKFIPDEGKLTICGYDIADLIDNAHAEDRFGYEELAYLLKVEPGAPLLLSKRISFDMQGAPREFVTTYYRADQYHIEVELDA